MNRRNFLQSAGIVLAAPAIVRADSLMNVVPWDTDIIEPESWWSARLAEQLRMHAPGFDRIVEGEPMPSRSIEVVEQPDGSFEYGDPQWDTYGAIKT